MLKQHVYIYEILSYAILRAVRRVAFVLRYQAWLSYAILRAPVEHLSYAILRAVRRFPLSLRDPLTLSYAILRQLTRLALCY